MCHIIIPKENYLKTVSFALELVRHLLQERDATEDNKACHNASNCCNNYDFLIKVARELALWVDGPLDRSVKVYSLHYVFITKITN